MYLIPLTQLESVELVVHALRAAAGEADCTQCPARRVCMKQCLSIATAIEHMFKDQSQTSVAPPGGDESTRGPGKASHDGDRRLKIIK